jgi:hypothetical protein
MKVCSPQRPRLSDLCILSSPLPPRHAVWCFAPFAALNSTLVTQLLRIKRSERHSAARPTAQYAILFWQTFLHSCNFYPHEQRDCSADSAVTEFCNKMSLQVRIASKSITRNTSREERVTKKMKPNCLTVASGMNLKNESVL